MDDSTPAPPALSVVVPFYNEEARAFVVIDELCTEIEKLGLVWEVLLVNDGSGDRTADELARAQVRWPLCRIMGFDQNRGQGAALLCGIRNSQAAIIVTMDGDGQNVPADIGTLLGRLQTADLVNGVRTPRHDSRWRRSVSRLANFFRGRLLHDGVTDAGCALKAFRREVASSFVPVKMLNPFMPALAAASGWRVVEQPVRHRSREAGVSKYGLRALFWRPVLDLFTISRIVHQRRQGSV